MHPDGLWLHSTTGGLHQQPEYDALLSDGNISGGVFSLFWVTREWETSEARSRRHSMNGILFSFNWIDLSELTKPAFLIIKPHPPKINNTDLQSGLYEILLCRVAPRKSIKRQFFITVLSFIDRNKSMQYSSLAVVILGTDLAPTFKTRSESPEAASRAFWPPWNDPVDDNSSIRREDIFFLFLFIFHQQKCKKPEPTKGIISCKRPFFFFKKYSDSNNNCMIYKCFFLSIIQAE